MNPTYLATARLMAEIAPTVFESGVFALKGGTAINLFLRDMPLLSVDLYLVFSDHRVPRAQALTATTRLCGGEQQPRNISGRPCQPLTWARLSCWCNAMTSP
jgi:hypothetical protein